MTRRELLAAGLALGLSPLSRRLFAQEQPNPAVPTIDDFFRDFTADWVRRDPNLATATRYFAGDEQDRLERQLTPQTVEWRRERIQRARQGLAQLRRFDPGHLTEAQRVSAEVMDWQLDNVVGEEPYLDYAFPLEQFRGANTELVELLTVRHPVLTERDAENYLAVLGQVGPGMDEAAEEARRLAAKHILPPRFVLTATIVQMQAFADTPPGKNPFVATFADRMAAIRSLPDDRREQFRAEAEKIVIAQINPAWKQGVAVLQGQIAPATDDAGLWRFEGGSEIYAYALGRFTTTTLTANEIHEFGLMQVKLLETEVDSRLRRLGRADGSVKDRLKQLGLDMRYPDPTSDKSRAQILQDIEGIIRDAEQRAALLFDRRPKSPVVVQPFPQFLEENAGATYLPPPADGSRPGIYQQSRRVPMMNRFGLRTLVYHETVPGHHFQMARQLENQELPRFRQVGAFGLISAFVEGWAGYAEHLASESGWYADDVEGQVGQLKRGLTLARRLVVDTGLHAMKWTRQQAIDYGFGATEVERYVVWPGQACSYMIGQSKILALRDQAKKKLGERFSLRDFHNTVLTTGSVPLDVLTRAVERYVKTVEQR